MIFFQNEEDKYLKVSLRFFDRVEGQDYGDKHMY